MSVFRAVWGYIRRDAAILAVGLGIVVIAGAVLLAKGVQVFQGGEAYLFNIRVMTGILVLFFASHAIPEMLRAKPKRPLMFLISTALDSEYRNRVLKGVPIIGCVILFMVVFGIVKSSIPLFTEFAWDSSLIKLDRALHGGADPWRLLQPVLGFPLITSALSGVYHLWFMLIFGGTVYFAIYQKDADLRRRYFLSYFLIWAVCGMLMAVGFASVGPCFVNPLLGIHTFDEQMTYLRAADTYWPVATIEVQETLLGWHRAGNHGFGKGISAMPSMHVALAFLFFLAMRHVSRRAAYLSGAFFALILISSVHLAYHYAVDGYAAILTTAAIWWLTKSRPAKGATIAT